MMMLIRICNENWHAVERDLLALSWSWSRVEKKFTHIMTGVTLSLWTLISIVVSSPPGTAVYHAETRSGPLTPEAQFLANMSEQQAGVISLRSRYDRHGADSVSVAPRADSFDALPDYGGFKLDALPVDEMLARREELMQAARDGNLGPDKVLRDEYNPFARGHSKIVGAL